VADCLFCAIAAGEVAADVVRRGDRALAFRDINPQAPTHVLVIPLDHHADVAAMTRADPELLVEVWAMAADIAEAEGIAGSGWRAVANIGADGGQTVGHVHIHVLGGRSLSWPPG
jgi:histidine triad (HIT) family protein